MNGGPKFEPGHGYTQEDWDEVSDNPELTEADFARAKPGHEVFPAEMLEALKAKRHRGPQRAPTKVQITLRLDRDVIESFKAEGLGWQARINAALRASRFGDRK